MSHPSGTLRRPMGAWNPWRGLASRHDVVVAWDYLPEGTGGGVHFTLDDGTSVIGLCRTLTQAERQSVLAHELVHHERGGGCDADYMPDCWQAVVVREERWTDDEAVMRMVPPAELMRVCVELEMSCTHVDPHHIAEHFHVSEAMARRALELQDKRLMQAVDRVWGG